MFSPMSVGAYIYQSLVGPKEGEDEDDDVKREVLAEEDGSSSDSDGGTSADPPGVRASLGRSRRGKESNHPPVEVEIITSDTASQDYCSRQDEFASKLAALAGAGGGDDMATANVGGDASKGLNAIGVLDDEESRSELHSGLDASIQFTDESARCEEDELQFAPDLNSDSESASSSSTPSDETMSTVRENTDNCQLELDENSDSWPDREEHVYIAPDLEFPFYKMTVQAEETVDLAELLENMDKEIEVEPPKPEEGKYIPKPITDDELDSALKILRSGKPPPTRSWYSLDNISSYKPNRAFALYYPTAGGRRERRNSADTKEDLATPKGNGVVFGLTGRAHRSVSSYPSGELLRDADLNIPDERTESDPEPAKGDVYMPSSTFPENSYIGQRSNDSNSYYPQNVQSQKYPPKTFDKPTPPDTYLKSHSLSNPRSPPPSNSAAETFESVCPPSPETNSLFSQPPLLESLPSPPPPPSPLTPLSDSFNESSQDWPLPPPAPEMDSHPTVGAYPDSFHGVTTEYSLPENTQDPRLSENDVDPVPKNLADDFNLVSDPKDSPLSPEPYISASVKHPKVFHLPPLQSHSEMFEVQTQVFPKRKTWEDVQYPVLTVTQKEAAFVEIENIIPEKKTYPVIPPKPKFLNKKPIVEKPVRTLVSQEEAKIDFSALESKEVVHDKQDDSPLSPQPYISASVKHPSVYSMPSFGSPEQVASTNKGRITEDEQFPVFTKVHKELALSELENVIPKRKVPPKVPPKPSFAKRQVKEPALVQSGVSSVEHSVDFTKLIIDEPSKDTPKKEPYLEMTDTQEAEEKPYKEHKASIENEVVVIQDGISVYREQSEEFFPGDGGKPVFMLSESLQISDAGDTSYIPVEKKSPPPDEISPGEPLHATKKPQVEQSPSREMVEIIARLSQHRLESGEQLTETVVSFHEQDIEEEGSVSSPSSSESEDLRDVNESTVVGLSTSQGERHVTDPSTSAPESASEDSAPLADPFDEVSSSTDEFMTEADLAISKMEAAMNSNNLEDITSSSSSSSSDDSSQSSDSEDSSSESAEEHTYIVSEVREDDYDRGSDAGRVRGLKTSLSLVIEEGDEDEYEESGSEMKTEDDGDDKEKIEETFEKDRDEYKTQITDDNALNDKRNSVNEVPFNEEVAKPVEVAQEQELPDDVERTPVIPVEVERYPKYMNYERPIFDNKQPVEESYKTWPQPEYDFKGTTAFESSRPQPASPETYPPIVITEHTFPAVPKEDSVTSDEIPAHVLEDMDQMEREYREETMDFSSEYSDEPEWQSAPPSTGARVFVLTANMQYPVKVMPSRDLVSPVHHQPERVQLGNEEMRETVRGAQEDLINEDDRRDNREQEDGFEPSKYFKPITEAAPTVSEGSVQDQARPIPHYTNEHKPEYSSPVEDATSKSNDPRTVTVTYTVIHTTSTSPQTVDGIQTGEERQGDDRKYPDADRARQPSDEENNTGVKSDSGISGEFYYSGASHGQHPPANTPAYAAKQQTGTSFESDDTSIDHIDDSDKDDAYDDTRTPVTDLDKYESMYKVTPGETTETRSNNHIHEAPESGDKSSADIDPYKSAHPGSKSVPVNAVGPYIYDSTSDHPEDNQPRESTADKTEPNLEESVVMISSRELESPERKPTGKTTITSVPESPDTEDVGLYKYSSWYEETSEDVPAMAIALVKSDIRLPSEYIAEREAVKKPEPKPKPKPKPKEVSVIKNTNSGSPEKMNEGAYRFTSWYEEPTEEKPENPDDVILLPSFQNQEESSPTDEKPLSPDVEPGTYRYCAWYEEADEQPSGGDFFVLSVPAASEEKSASVKPASPTKERSRYKYSALYEEPEEKPAEKEDYFVLSAPSEPDRKSNSDSSDKNKDSREKQPEGHLSRSALYEDLQSAIKEPPETFVISKPYEDTQLRPVDDTARSHKATADDLYYPIEGDSRRNIEGSASGRSSRINSNGSSSRTSGSLADVSATSGEAMRRTWSDESGSDKNGVQDLSTFAPPVVQRLSQSPPQPKPRKGVPSAPSSSDDEQQRQPRRHPGRPEVKPRETTADEVTTLTPRAEYALATTSWRQMPMEDPSRKAHESVIWDSGDDKRREPTDPNGRNNRYSVSDKSRHEIQTMLDSLVTDDDAFEMPSHLGKPFEAQDPPPRRQDDMGYMGQMNNDGSRSMTVLPQMHPTKYDIVETSFQDTRQVSASVPHIPRPFDDDVGRNHGPNRDFVEPLLSLRPQQAAPPEHADKRPIQRQVAVRGDSQDDPANPRKEYRLAAASWENMSSASDESRKRTKMETWDNDPDPRGKQTEYPGAVLPHRYGAERAPAPSEAYDRPRGPSGNGLVVRADVHAPFVHQPVPGDPELAVQLLSASASAAELAPPPPRHWGNPQKAHSTIGINQPPVRPERQTVLPDAEADLPRRHHRQQGRPQRPPSQGSKTGRPRSPATISTYSSTQSLPARILPRSAPDNELERLKRQIATIGKQLEIKNSELRKIHVKNPSVRHHIPMRGPRGELISPDGRVLSTPEAPNKAELEKYKRFFEKLPEPHFRRLMHEMLEYKHMVKQKEEDIRRLKTQCIGIRKRLHQLSKESR